MLQLCSQAGLAVPACGAHRDVARHAEPQHAICPSRNPSLPTSVPATLVCCCHTCAMCGISVHIHTRAFLAQPQQILGCLIQVLRHQAQHTWHSASSAVYLQQLQEQARQHLKDGVLVSGTGHEVPAVAPHQEGCHDLHTATEITPCRVRHPGAGGVGHNSHAAAGT